MKQEGGGSKAGVYICLPNVQNSGKKDRIEKFLDFQQRKKF